MLIDSNALGYEIKNMYAYIATIERFGHYYFLVFALFFDSSISFQEFQCTMKFTWKICSIHVLNLYEF